MTTATAPNPSQEIVRAKVPELDLAPGQVACFRSRRRDGGWWPIIAWGDPEDGVLVRIGDREVQILDEELFEQRLATAVRNPISRAQYDRVMNGGGWDDVADGAGPGIGHNSGDSAESWADQVEAAKSSTKAFEKIADDETAAKAQSLRSRLLELAGEGEKQHKAEKEPHLKAGRDIDAKWLPAVKSARAAADMLRTAMSRHETAKAEAERERLRKIEGERRQAEDAARAAGAPPPPPPEPAVEQPKPAQVKGGYGRAAAVRDKVITRIVNQDEFYQSVRMNVDVVIFLANLAMKLGEKGAQLPGCEQRIEKDVR